MADRITSDRGIAALKPAAKPYERAASDARGLYIRVFPTAAKLWEFRYVADNGVRRRLPLGPYPGLSFSDARAKAYTLRAAVVGGRDPAAERAAKRAESRSGETLSELADAYFRAAEKGLHRAKGRPKREKTLSSERTRFNLHIKPALGSRRFKDLKRSDLKAFMNRLAAEGEFSADTVSSIGRTFSAILAFAVHEERIEANPIAGLTSPLELKPRERLFDEAALGALWRGLSATLAIKSGGKAPSRRGPNAPAGRASADQAASLALRLLILCLCRRVEAAGARWSEFDFKTNVWTIPAERSKSRRAHVVPLSGAAIDVLTEARSHSAGRPQDFVFPSPISPKRHVREDVLTRAVARTCERLKLPHRSPHDLRRTAATILTGEKLGVRRFIVSKLLGHAAQDGAVVTGIYDRNDYLAEKRAALEAWGKHVLAVANSTSLHIGADDLTNTEEEDACLTADRSEAIFASAGADTQRPAHNEHLS